MGFIRKHAKLVPLLALWLAGAPATPAPPADAPPAPAVAAGFDKLALDEEFNDSTADVLKRWTVALWFNPKNASTHPVSVNNGIATFTAPAPPGFKSAWLSSWPQHTFRFGYFEARMRWPATHGNWAAFWLLSGATARAAVVGKWPPNCEIDISEALGGRGYHSTVHHWLTGSKQTGEGRQNSREVLGYDTNAWHTYGALWQPGRITFYFDGEPVHSVTPPSECDSQDMIVVLGAQRYDNESQTAQFDWLRVWQGNG